MSTFGEVKEAIRRAIVRNAELTSDGNAALSDDTVSYYIKRAIDHYKSEKFFFNEKSLEDSTTTLIANQNFLTVPSDFVEPIIWRITQNNFDNIISLRRYTDIEEFRTRVTSSSTGRPDVYAIKNKKFELFTTPNQALTTRLTYVFDLPALVNDSDTNDWVIEGENLIRNKAQEFLYRERLHNDIRAAAFELSGRNDFNQLKKRTHDQQRSRRTAIDPFMTITRY